jgi:hypothetical protein
VLLSGALSRENSKDLGADTWLEGETKAVWFQTGAIKPRRAPSPAFPRSPVAREVDLLQL